MISDDLFYLIDECDDGRGNYGLHILRQFFEGMESHIELPAMARISPEEDGYYLSIINEDAWVDRLGLGPYETIEDIAATIRTLTGRRCRSRV